MNKIVHKHDIVEYQDFLTKEECEFLIDYYESSPASWQETCFFNTRVMDPNEPANLFKAGKALERPINDLHQQIAFESYFDSLKSKLKEKAEEVFNREVKNLTLSAHKWMIGAYASDHYDNAEIDGTPNAWQNNKLVTILYLNDNYEGGNLTFNEHNLAIAPKQGTLVVFDVGVSNLHGVNEIISGVRYTMLSSWDWADSVYPEGYLKSLLQGRDEEKEKQDQQKKEWKKDEKYVSENLSR